MSKIALSQKKLVFFYQMIKVWLKLAQKSDNYNFALLFKSGNFSAENGLVYQCGFCVVGSSYKQPTSLGLDIQNTIIVC